ncbi:hypothetical protein HWV62_12430 [Athelia sp. TMB]|nr:hypothetical protein HWV62_12430 [Athelia sp. TMB]
MPPSVSTNLYMPTFLPHSVLSHSPSAKSPLSPTRRQGIRLSYSTKNRMNASSTALAAPSGFPPHGPEGAAHDVPDGRMTRKTAIGIAIGLLLFIGLICSFFLVAHWRGFTPPPRTRDDEERALTYERWAQNVAGKERRARAEREQRQRQPAPPYTPRPLSAHSSLRGTPVLLPLSARSSRRASTPPPPASPPPPADMPLHADLLPANAPLPGNTSFPAETPLPAALPHAYIATPRSAPL